MKMHTITFVAALLCTSICCKAQNYTEALDAIRSQYQLAGLAAAVVCADDTQLYFGGARNLQTGAPIDANTLFRIASISKSFTAIGLMKLYDQGLFSLDDDISEALGYLLRNPAFPEIPITYRMLLSHTSSVNDGSGYGPFLGATVATDNPLSITEILEPLGTYYTSDIWRTEMPGTHFAYTNLVYGIVGTLIEALSGQRFDVYMRESVLLPLNIVGSYNVGDLDDINQLAVLYRIGIPQIDNYNGLTPPPFSNPNYVPGTNGLRFGPQGGLRTNLNGILTLGKLIINNGMHGDDVYLQSTTVQTMIGPEWTYNESNGDNYFGLFNSWGLGIHRSLGFTGFATGDAIVPGQLFVGHAGEAYGLLSNIFIQPEHGYMVAFVTNGLLQSYSYAWGFHTSFYRMEEEVFDVLTETSWEDCALGLSAKPNKTERGPCFDIRTNASPNSVLINTPGLPGYLEVLASDGRSLHRIHTEASHELSIDLGHGRGLVFVRWVERNGAHSCIKKIFLH